MGNYVIGNELGENGGHREPDESVHFRVSHRAHSAYESLRLSLLLRGKAPRHSSGVHITADGRVRHIRAHGLGVLARVPRVLPPLQWSAVLHQ